MKPIIGVVEWPYQDKDGDVIYEVNKKIVDKISEHGAVAIGLFPTQVEDYLGKSIRDIGALTKEEMRDIKDAICMCDAIIKPGATRIYGYEKYIIDKALEDGYPFLGICAGMQIMANYRKQGIQNNIKNDTHINHNTKEKYAHAVWFESSSRLYHILGKQEIEVNSRHNYHVPNDISLGKLNVSGYADDQIIEAIENPQHHFQIGVQWHPELLEDENSDKLFGAFVEEAAKQKVKKFYQSR